MARNFHLAILECDTPVESVRLVRGTYGDIFKKALLRGLEAKDAVVLDTELQFSAWDVVAAQDYPDLKTVDGLLLTGSKHTAFHDEAWILRLIEFVREAHATTSIPIVGICFGHQIIARAFGGQLARNEKGWEIAVHDFNTTTEGREIFGTSTLRLHQMHRDIVTTIPQGFCNLGLNDRCAVQGLYLPGRILSLQAHPEFDGFIAKTVTIMRHKQGIFDDETYRDAMGRVSVTDDGPLVCSAIVRFLFSR